jgi:hypothetical protein
MQTDINKGKLYRDLLSAQEIQDSINADHNAEIEADRAENQRYRNVHHLREHDMQPHDVIDISECDVFDSDHMVDDNDDEYVEETKH